MREVVAEFRNPVMLWSVGKDSACLLRLAQKAFHPGPIPFPLMHVDTLVKFPEMIEFRDRYAQELGFRLIVETNDEAYKSRPDVRNVNRYCDFCSRHMKTQGLLAALEKHGFDAAIGGARREEERSRAKERVFSFRDEFGQWDPKNQRPELWNLFNGRKHLGEHFRVFPISNWTELDVWQYLAAEQVPLPSLYFAHDRAVFERDGILLADSPHIRRRPEEELFTARVRCRTIGDTTCTGVWRSEASSLEEIIAEVASSRLTERGGRADDKRSETAMEDRKREGYF